MIQLADDNLNDYEEGIFTIPVRRKWWQFWLPISISAGTYTRMGNNWELHALNRTWYSWGNKKSNKPLKPTPGSAA